MLQALVYHQLVSVSCHRLSPSGKTVIDLHSHSLSAFLYGGTGFVGLVICYFFVPETKGRSFLELDELFERRTPARNFRTTETSVDITRREWMERGRV